MPEKLLYRSCAFERASAKSDSRELELSFASEEPVERWDYETGRTYFEVLDHSSQRSADFTRLNNGGALLRDHDRTVQPGVIVKGTARIGNDRKSRARVKFSRGPVGEQEWQDVQDGIRTLVSVGYQTGREISREKNSEGVEVRRFEWMPYEISIVSIPADTTVGFGRSSNKSPNTMKDTNSNRNETDLHPREIKNEIRSCADLIIKSFPNGKAKIEREVAEAILSDTSPTEFKKRMKERIDDFKAPYEEMDATDSFAAAANGRSNIAGTDAGALFIRSDDYRRAAAMKGRQQRSASVEIPYRSFLNFRTTAATTGLTSIDKQPGIVQLGVQPTRVAELMGQTPTQNTTIRYIRENSLNNAAAFVAEGGQKPEAAWDLVEVDAAVKKIAVIGRVTDEFFMDYDATRDYINTRLGYMVGIKEDNALLNADGTGNQITGILQTVGIQTQVQGGDTVLDMILKAIVKIRSVGFFEPDAIVMNPNDLQNIRLMKDRAGNYLAPGGGGTTNQFGAAINMADVIWRLPVVSTTSIAQGTCLVGAFRLGSTIFRRMGLTIETTNSDASDFQYNRIAVRAETRLALAVFRPLAFCVCTGANGTAFQ